MKVIKLIVVVMLLAIITSLTQDSIQAQDNPRACTDTVQTALEAAKRLCTEIGRHKACYGNLLVDAEPQKDVNPFKFDEPGDVVEVASLKSLRLSPFDPEENIWGIAQLYLQADIPASAPQNVTLILFGDVHVENAVAPTPVLDVTLTGENETPVLAEPMPIAETLGTATPNQLLKAVGRSADGQWVEVAFVDDTVQGWISVDRIADGVEISELPVTDGSMPYQTPMQAFYLQTGANDYECTDIPSDGLLVQTPEGIAQVTLLINEVNIELGSTAFIQARPNENMQITMLEGKARVSSGGVVYDVPAGEKIEIPMTADMTPADVPAEPTVYVAQDIVALPTDLLTEPIEIVAPVEVETEDSSTGNNGGKSNNGDNGNHGTGNNGNGNGNSSNPPSNNGNGNGNTNNGNNGNSGNGNNGNGNGNSQSTSANVNQSTSSSSNNGNSGNQSNNGNNGNAQNAANNGNNGNGNNANNGNNGNQSNNGNNGNGNQSNNGNGNNGNSNNAQPTSVPATETSGNNNNGNNGNGNNGNNGNGNNGNGNNGNGNGVPLLDGGSEQGGAGLDTTPIVIGSAIAVMSAMVVTRRRK